MADWAWMGLGAAILTYELVATRREWELLSEACDRYRARHPWVTRGAIGYVSAHLLRLIPRPVDPLHLLATRIRPRDEPD